MIMKEKYNSLSRKQKSILHGAAYVAVIALIAFIWNSFFFSPLKVSGDSMNPALRDKDLVIVDRISYKVNGAERFDMVIFPYKYDNSRKLIKRVIGLPGETVEIIDSVIYINGEELEEYYGIYDKNMVTRYSHFGPVKLGDDEYFVMGDNRDHSDDSRSDDVGAIKEDEIIGKLCFSIWPFNAIGSLKYQ